jgi:hypothetical protein
VPPSQYVLKTWLSKHNGIKNVRVKTTVTAIENDKPTEVHFKENTLLSIDRMNLKSWVADDSDKKLYGIEKSSAALSPVAKLLFSGDWRDVIGVLKEKNIPIRTEEELLSLKTEPERLKVESEFLSRIGGHIAWVIGGSGIKENFDPQIWFEKDTFLPLRIVYLAKDGEVYDVQFDHFRFSREFPYPRNLTIARKGKGILISSQLIELNVSSDTSFPKQSHSSNSEDGFTDAGRSASSALKDLIRLYYDVVR